MKKVKLTKGDIVKMLPVEELFKILKQRNFCTNDETRKWVSEAIGGKKGIVESIEDRYAFDYFYFEISDGTNYSVPYEAVDPYEPIIFNDPSKRNQKLSPELQRLVDRWNEEKGIFKVFEKRFMDTMTAMVDLNKKIYDKAKEEGIDMEKLNL